MDSASRQTETATFGAGCFWVVEDAFRKVPGVVDASVGYMGGAVANPTYEQVCSHTTGHAEVVQVKYDSNMVSYKELLLVFWNIHDPTTLNRQGADVGSQYRSVIFYHTDDQKQQAEKLKLHFEQSKRYSRQIVTAIEPADIFYRAEEYHQRYFEKQGGGSCHIS